MSNCPDWLIKKLQKAGGILPFKEYMSLVLNDPEHGAYGSGQLRIGTQGDFVTSPSMGSEFANLLAVQIVDWFDQIFQRIGGKGRISLVEIGPGEGDLIYDTLSYIIKFHGYLIPKIQVILVENSPYMKSIQKNKLKTIKHIPISWKTLNELALDPVNGVMIAHEMLDALPVDRLVWSEGSLWQQGVAISHINDTYSLTFKKLPIPNSLSLELSEAKEVFGLSIPPKNAPEGWSSEWHSELKNWFSSTSLVLNSGILLVVDYCLEASRYYTSDRSSGTLLAYKNQSATTSLLEQPGCCDLTAHLCIETTLGFASSNGWSLLGKVKQGQALLALGLASKLHQLQQFSSEDIEIALSKREELLRLVSPSGLGSFYWLAFEKLSKTKYKNENVFNFRSRFLEEPISQIN